MARVTGIGGAFFKGKETTRRWWNDT